MTKHKNTAFHRALHRWYASHGRKTLPWRTTRDPYAIYVSEIMLQQTQVKTVLERYYFPFLKRFPTLASLAKAKREDVLKAWQGLGYYNRAVNLHEAAKRIQDSGFGIQGRKEINFLNPESRILIPRLMSLPGVGRNTAHAVAAFAYKKPVPVMETNVKRVLCRIFALKNPSENELWEKAAALLDKDNPFDYNQAMMDLGALVCAKRAPECAECPAGALCKGKISPASYPAAKKKKAPPVRKKQIIVLRNRNGEYFAEPRKGKFLNGMYRFVEKDNPLPTPLPLKGEGSLRSGRVKVIKKFLGNIRQQYSHFTLEAEVYLKHAGGRGKYWHAPEQLRALPLSGAEQKILALIKQKKYRRPEVKK